MQKTTIGEQTQKNVETCSNWQDVRDFPISVSQLLLNRSSHVVWKSRGCQTHPMIVFAGHLSWKQARLKNRFVRNAEESCIRRWHLLVLAEDVNAIHDRSHFHSHARYLCSSNDPPVSSEGIDRSEFEFFGCDSLPLFLAPAGCCVLSRSSFLSRPSSLEHLDTSVVISFCGNCDEWTCINLKWRKTFFPLLMWAERSISCRHNQSLWILIACTLVVRSSFQRASYKPSRWVESLRRTGSIHPHS